MRRILQVDLQYLIEYCVLREKLQISVVIVYYYITGAKFCQPKKIPSLLAGYFLPTCNF
jgi:hypothetical protein